MSYPELGKLYDAIVKDCYEYFKGKVDKNNIISIEKLYKSFKNHLTSFDMLCILKSFILVNKEKDTEYSYLTTYSSLYLNNIFKFFGERKMKNIEVKYYDNFCLAYIALVGFKYFFNKDINFDDVFLFDIKTYENFSKIIFEYSLVNDLKKFYENYSLPIKIKYINDNNLYLYLIIKFDADYIFYPQLIQDKDEHEIKVENNINNGKSDYISNNGVDLNTTKDNSSKKENNLIKDFNEDKNVKDNILNMNSNNNNRENQLIITNNLDENFNKKNKNKIQDIEINNNKMKFDNEKYENNKLNIDDRFSNIESEIKYLNSNEGHYFQYTFLLYRIRSSTLLGRALLDF